MARGTIPDNHIIQLLTFIYSNLNSKVEPNFGFKFKIDGIQSV